MNQETDYLSELQDIYKTYCKDKFYECFKLGGFTKIGEENGANITFMNIHCYKKMCLNIPDYHNNWHSCRFPDEMDSTFEKAFTELKVYCEKSLENDPMLNNHPPRDLRNG